MAPCFRGNACRPAADVHQMGQYLQLRRVNSRCAESHCVWHGRRLFCVRHRPPRGLRRVERCALAVARFPDPHMCACAHCLRVPRASYGRAPGRPDAGPAFDDTVRIFFGAGAGAAAVGSDLSLQPPPYGKPLPASTSLFWYFFNARLGPRHHWMFEPGHVSAHDGIKNFFCPPGTWGPRGVGSGLGAGQMLKQMLYVEG